MAAPVHAGPNAELADLPIAAEIVTTLATEKQQIRQFAFDGNEVTWFGTASNPGKADHFTLVFEKPVVAGSLTVLTGRPDDSERLESGALEVSEDGKTFKRLLQFSEGQARGDAGGALIKAIRIQPGVDHDHPLAIREITIASQPAIAIFKYPIEFAVDVTDAPEMQPWAEKVARICELAYPMINEELQSDGYRPPHYVTMTLKSRYRGVAEASGNRITGSVKFFTDHPDDVGAMVHETAHVVQQYKGRGNPGWLVEGVADYVRFFKFEPSNLGRIDIERARYNSSYRVSAAFLAWVSARYDKQLVLKLNRLMREGKYNDEVFAELTGKQLDELDQEWRATLKVAAIDHANENWPKFRGPDGQGRAPSGRIPATWSESENILWKLPIPGRGWSSPVISDGVCWLTAAVVQDASPAQKAVVLREKLASNPLAKEMEIIDSVSLRAVSIDLQSGRVLKDIDLLRQQDPEPIHSLNSYASPTPVLNADKLYCHFGNMGTVCLDTKTADVVWTTRLPLEHSVGPGSSPVVYENHLIIPCDGTDSQSVVALDTANGNPVWRTKRPSMTGDMGDMHKAFSTPLVFNDGQRDQVVVPGAQWVVSYDPRDGQPLWQVRHGEGFSNAPCPVYANGIVYICTGYMTPELVAIRVDGQGDVTKSHVVWRINKQVPAMSSPVIVENRIYMVSDQGVVTCADAQTGDVLFRDRAAGNYSASPLAVDGKLLFSSRQGDVTVIGAGSTWELYAKNHLDGQLMASPAVWRDSLIIRSDSHLYRIGQKR
jgi:outer membrane protein assembly factor BamB